jgi:hypothetical protein
MQYQMLNFEIPSGDQGITQSCTNQFPETAQLSSFSSPSLSRSFSIARRAWAFFNFSLSLSRSSVAFRTR